MAEPSQNIYFLENWVLNLRNAPKTKMWAKWFLRKPNLKHSDIDMAINRQHYSGRWDGGYSQGWRGGGRLIMIMLHMVFSAEGIDPLSKQSSLMD